MAIFFEFSISCIPMIHLFIYWHKWYLNRIRNRIFFDVINRFVHVNIGLCTGIFTGAGTNFSKKYGTSFSTGYGAGTGTFTLTTPACPPGLVPAFLHEL